MLVFVLAGLLSAVASGAENSTESPAASAGSKKAIALVCGGKNSSINGSVVFEQADRNSPIRIKGCITGLVPKSKHGFHVHTFGDIHDHCKNTGPHFNPSNSSHGSPQDPVRHAGDLGNVIADEKGEIRFNITDSVLRIGGQNCIIGRSVVLHEKEDDLGKGGHADSVKTGNAGSRIACGVIGIAELK